MWGISIRSRTQLRIFRNAFRGKSSKDKCENYKENYEYYVSIKRRISKRLRNICNWLRNIQNLFLVFENLLFLYFQRKKKNWPLFLNFHIPKYFSQTSNQLPNSQIWKEPPSTTGELNPGPPAPLTSLLPLDQASFLRKFTKLCNKNENS